MNVVISVGGFVFSWTPYAVVAMWCAFKNCDDISPLFQTLMANFAKSSMVWTPALFLFASQKMILNVRESLSRIRKYSSIKYNSSRTKNIKKCENGADDNQKKICDSESGLKQTQLNGQGLSN